VGPLTLAATCAGIPSQEPLVRTVAQATISTQTDPPVTRKTYVAILKSAGPKNPPRTTASAPRTDRVVVEGTSTPKPLMIAPKPSSPPQIIPTKVVLETVPAVPFVPDVPKIEDIQPTITQQDDTMFDWFSDKSSTTDLFSEIPLSLGSPDSGLGSDHAGSETETSTTDQDLMDTFGPEISDLSSAMSPISDSLDIDSENLFFGHLFLLQLNT